MVVALRLVNFKQLEIEQSETFDSKSLAMLSKLHSLYENFVLFLFIFYILVPQHYGLFGVHTLI